MEPDLCVALAGRRAVTTIADHDTAHAICDGCWSNRYKDETEPPARVRESIRVEELCCFCGSANSSGIYVRHDLEGLVCQDGRTSE